MKKQSLAATHSSLLELWHPTMSGDASPKMVSASRTYITRRGKHSDYVRDRVCFFPRSPKTNCPFPSGASILAAWANDWICFANENDTDLNEEEKKAIIDYMTALLDELKGRQK